MPTCSEIRRAHKLISHFPHLTSSDWSVFCCFFFSNPPRSSGVFGSFVVRLFSHIRPVGTSLPPLWLAETGRGPDDPSVCFFFLSKSHSLIKITEMDANTKKKSLVAPGIPERLMRHGAEISPTSGLRLELLARYSSFTFDTKQRRNANKRGPPKDRRYYM